MRHAATLLLTLLIGGCATATPYQPLQDGFGYTEQRIEEQRFRVRFSGNDLTERDSVENYLLYRAAEITLANDGTHFLMTDASTDARTTYSQTVSTGFGLGRFSHFGLSTGIGVGTARPKSSSYEAQAYIIVLNGTEERGELRAFDARQVKNNLEARIQRPD